MVSKSSARNVCRSETAMPAAPTVAKANRALVPPISATRTGSAKVISLWALRHLKTHCALLRGIHQSAKSGEKLPAGAPMLCGEIMRLRRALIKIDGANEFDNTLFGIE